MSTSTTKTSITIRPATFPADTPTVRSLFLAYASSLPISLDFQDFETELAGLPGKYAVEKGGGVWLAFASDTSTASLTFTSTSKLASQAGQTSQQLALENLDSKNAEENVIGIIALRPFSPPMSCEIKRLYLTPTSRGKGLGRELLDVIVKRAEELGYEEILLDTLDSMGAAMRLYEGYGFERCEQYYESVEGAVFYRLRI